MAEINIVELIENNPITKLSQNYNVKLLEKMQTMFSDFEQHLFLSSFYCYLNCHPTKDFVINLDDVWTWLEFNQKSNAKRLLENNFMIGKDYIKFDKQNKELAHGGHNKEIFMLNVETFKKFCLKAGTSKASEIHNYYIKMEQLIHETIEEECNDMKLQLQQLQNTQNETTILLEEEKRNKKKAVEETLINLFPVNTECIYIGIIDDTNGNNEKLIKFGHSNNLSHRIADHRNKYHNFILIDAYKVSNRVEIENLIKMHPKIKKQMRTIVVNGKNKTEIIAYDDTEFTINHLKKIIKEIINSRTYSVEKFNELLKQNELLLTENDDLKTQLKKCQDKIVEQTIEINDMKETIDKQTILLKSDEHDNTSQIVYQNPILPQNEETDKFNNFINEMCIVRSDVDESSVNLEGAFRIWNRTKPKKETFHTFKEYLDVRFRQSRISSQNKNQLVHGYIGVKLIPIQYKKKYISDDTEMFLFNVCSFNQCGKIFNSTLLTEYQRWKTSLNKELTENDLKDIKKYLDNSEHVIKSTIWIENESSEGYYGISLKSDVPKHKKTSSTGKKVEKVESKTNNVLRIWDTIAKASEDEKMSAAKMSRSIKSGIIFNDDYFYRVG